MHFTMPNFYFHCSTAYDILRHCGVELGKRDFIGTILIGSVEEGRADLPVSL